MNIFETELAKTMKFCSSKEVCTFDIKKRLVKQKTSHEFHEKIIKKLISENFINHERYAEAFVNDKLIFNKWGKTKIIFQLKNKQIEEKYINKAIEKIDEKKYINTINSLIKSKLKTIKSKEKIQKKQKTLNYLISKGFETDICYTIIEQHLK